mmetsp:Transcript_23295/g.58263  ORF Transcript_23295/g.58263 Transcript_23295/m.58263 type:complete len:327 (-) Transcript_23295:258-1238(-)
MRCTASRLRSLRLDDTERIEHRAVLCRHLLKQQGVRIKNGDVAPRRGVGCVAIGSEGGRREAKRVRYLAAHAPHDIHRRTRTVGVILNGNAITRRKAPLVVVRVARVHEVYAEALQQRLQPVHVRLPLHRPRPVTHADVVAVCVLGHAMSHRFAVLVALAAVGIHAVHATVCQEDNPRCLFPVDSLQIGLKKLKLRAQHPILARIYPRIRVDGDPVNEARVPGKVKCGPGTRRMCEGQLARPRALPHAVSVGLVIVPSARAAVVVNVFAEPLVISNNKDTGHSRGERLKGTEEVVATVATVIVSIIGHVTHANKQVNANRLASLQN